MANNQEHTHDNQSSRRPSNAHQSNLSNQLADLRQSYHQAGSTPPIQNIPPPPNNNNNNNNNLFPNENIRNSYSSTSPLSNTNNQLSHSNRNIHELTRNSSFNSPHIPFTSSSFKSISRIPGEQQSTNSYRESIIEDLTDQQKAQIVRRHLMTKDEQEAARRVQEDPSGSQLRPGSIRSSSAASSASPDHRSTIAGTDQASLLVDDDSYPSPFHLQGGDIHHAVYKWANRQQHQQPIPSSSQLPNDSRFNSLALNRTRSVSMSGSLRPSEIGLPSGPEHHNDDAPNLVYKDIMQPGGFRRAFLHQKRAAIGKPYEPSDGRRFTKSFIDFLSLYGHFGGEDLEEIDEGEEAAFRALRRQTTLEEGSSFEEEEEEESGEHSTLLGRSGRRVTGAGAGGVQSSGGRARGTKKPKSGVSSRYPGFQDGSNGDASVTQAVFMLLKSLVGTGVLFLAKAFANGGLLFSVLTLVFISIISLFSFVLLVETRLQIPGGFGEIGGILYGPWCRRTILFSLVISQIGFVAAYTIFIAQNLQAFILAVTDCASYVPIWVLIFGQVIVYLPLAMIRNIQKLSGTALVADAFILIGLLYVFGFELHSIVTKGVPPIVMFNRESFPLLIGTAVFTFEGIGLIIPITESMKEPQKFPGVLAGVMLALTVLFASAGAWGYAAFGTEVQSVVLLNLPQDNRFVNAVQFLYSMAIMLSTPLQLFPAVRIMENGLFQSSGKYSNQVKWKKNSFRTLTVFGCALIAWMGAADLDKFVSLIGSMACVPLCFCYPAMLHYRAIAKTARQKFLDICLFLFGCFAAVYTSYQTLVMLINSPNTPGSSQPPKFGNCVVP
ncbi:neutral amino acid transporter [Puccinia graminis f. sp. tritici]|uniref:Neutral amino acid transporter n=1 Tax=Puccinia graminis f. sp. tritici TaxID=56615 RepID=A0A5B0LRT0_PUCGR|nr:neutral amino acid transporter [Puccinia graminis f. sp. tritici]